MQDEKPHIEPEVAEDPIEWEDAETTTRSDLISCAYYAYSTVEDIDLTLLSKIEANRIRKIKRKSMEIIENVIDEMHSEIFDLDEE